MGINPDAASYQPRGSYRGRGGNSYRGSTRGSANPGVNRSLKLDNRPKALAVVGSAVTSDQAETMRQVKEWFADFSDVLAREPVVVEDKVVVQFTNRGSAETVSNRLHLSLWTWIES